MAARYYEEDFASSSLQSFTHPVARKHQFEPRQGVRVADLSTHAGQQINLIPGMYLPALDGGPSPLHPERHAHGEQRTDHAVELGKVCTTRFQSADLLPLEPNQP